MFPIKKQDENKKLYFVFTMINKLQLSICIILISKCLFAQEDCSKIGVDYQSFGASVLPYGFEELTTINFKSSICENEYYELDFWVSKDIYLAKLQREWPKHKDLNFEVQLFLAISGGNYDTERKYQPIIYELSSAVGITFDERMNKFKFQIYADAPYDVVTIGYKPLQGWWNVDRFFVDDILDVTSLSFNMMERDTLTPVEEIETELVLDTINFDTFKINEFNNRAIKDAVVYTVQEGNFILEITDHLEYDKDSVNVYLNRNQILNDYELNSEVKSLDLELNEGMNILILEAINLGDFSPNTAAFNLKFKDETHQKIMFSNLKQSDVVYIYYQK